jgi:hypothetical protein
MFILSDLRIIYSGLHLHQFIHLEVSGCETKFQRTANCEILSYFISILDPRLSENYVTGTFKNVPHDDIDLHIFRTGSSYFTVACSRDKSSSRL